MFALIGNTFDYIPRPVVVPAQEQTDWQIVNLIYRGNTYERKLPPPKPYQNLMLLTGVGSIYNPRSFQDEPTLFIHLQHCFEQTFNTRLP